jgi:hypothetical protein
VEPPPGGDAGDAERLRQSPSRCPTTVPTAGGPARLRRSRRGSAHGHPRLRAAFPNPAGLLQPGQYVRIRVLLSERPTRSSCPRPPSRRARARRRCSWSRRIGRCRCARCGWARASGRCGWSRRA